MNNLKPMCAVLIKDLAKFNRLCLRQSRFDRNPNSNLFIFAVDYSRSEISAISFPEHPEFITTMKGEFHFDTPEKGIMRHQVNIHEFDQAFNQVKENLSPDDYVLIAQIMDTLSVVSEE
jgi:hypothetical protein